MAAIQFPRLVDLGVRHAVTLRTDGISQPPYDRGNLGFGVPDDPAAVLANREAAAAAAGVSLDDLVVGRQVHGDRIAEVGPAERGRGARRPDGLPDTDALVTRSTDLALLSLIADCSALILYAPDIGAIGVAHLGWRGTVARLGETLARRMIDHLGAQPERLVGALAPGIGPCCYEVGEDVVSAVRTQFARPHELIVAHGRGVAFDIPAAILQQLEDAGLRAEQVERTDYCTACRTDLFFSHRAEGGRTGRFGVVAALPVA